MRVWDQEPTACYTQARGRADDFIFLPLVHRNSASKHTADFISAFKKRHLLPFFPANNTTIVMPAGPFPMMATCLFYFLHAFDKACPDMKRRYRSHCWKCVSVRPCCPAHNVSRIVFHGHTPANSPHSKGYFQTAAAPPAPAGCLKTNGSYPGSRLNGASFTALGHLVVQTSARLIYNVNRYIGEFFSLSHLSLL